MKVIAKISSERYICEVGHTELEKFFNLYYGKYKQLQVGEEVDLGKGYDHAAETADAMRKTQAFIEANQNVVTAILNGLQYSKIVQEGEKQLAVSEARAMFELNDETRWILGRPNFACGPVARNLRKMGQTIAQKSEDEQSAVIHWMLCLWEQHGEKWRLEANKLLAEAAVTSVMGKSVSEEAR